MCGLFKKSSRFQKLFTNFKNAHVFIFSGVLKLFSFNFLFTNFKKKNWAVQKCSRFQKLFAIFKNVHVFIFSGDLKIVQFKIFRKCSCFHIFQICSRFQFLPWNLKKFPFQKNVPDFCKHFIFFANQQFACVSQIPSFF